MKKIMVVILMLFSLSIFASETNERIYLTQILNQLAATKPLIVAAAKEQPKSNRIQFHYIAYRDANGKSQNGLLEDINEIEKGIREKLHHTSTEPRIVTAIKGDYINHVSQPIDMNKETV